MDWMDMVDTMFGDDMCFYLLVVNDQTHSVCSQFSFSPP